MKTILLLFLFVGFTTFVQPNPETGTQRLQEDIGRGFVVTSDVKADHIPNAVDCLADDYDGGFIYVYENNTFLNNSIQWIATMQKDYIAYSIQYVIKPRYDASADAATNIIGTIINKIKIAANADIKLIWVDIGFINQQQVADNVNFLSKLQTAATTKNIKLGIITSKSQWKNQTNDWSGPALSNDPLWFTDRDTSFGEFVPMAGWQSTAVINGVNARMCFTENGDVNFRQDVLYKRSVINTEGSTGTPTTNIPTTVQDMDKYNYGYSVYAKSNAYWIAFRDELECYKTQGKAFFLYIYDGDGVLDQVMHLLPLIIKAKMDIQIVIMPRTVELADKVYIKVMEAFDSYGFKPTSIWLDTYYYYFQSPDMNIEFCETLSQLFSLNGIKMNYITNTRTWIEYLGDWQLPALNGSILWDDQEILKEQEFNEFGGWTEVSAYTTFEVRTCRQNDDQYQARVLQVIYKPYRLDFNYTYNPSTPIPYITSPAPTSTSKLPTTSTTKTPITTPADKQASGVLISADSPVAVTTTDLANCFKADGDSAVFLYIYTNNQVNTILSKNAFDLQNAGFNVQFIIQPSFLVNATDVINNVTTTLNELNLSIDYLWIDTAFISNDVSVNKMFLGDILMATLKQNITVGIQTSQIQWTYGFGNYGTFSAMGALLWDRSSQSFGSFNSYGGWSRPTVLSSNLSPTCSFNQINMILTKVSYLSDFLRFVPLTTAQPNVSSTPSTVPTTSNVTLPTGGSTMGSTTTKVPLTTSTAASSLFSLSIFVSALLSVMS